MGTRLSLVVRGYVAHEPESNNDITQAPGPPPIPSRGVLNESTVGINWWWNRFTRVQFNWIRSMPDHLGSGLAPFDIYGTRFQVEF